MTLDQIINEYDEVVATIAADLASGLLEGYAKDKTAHDYELFKAGRDALKEKRGRICKEMG